MVQSYMILFSSSATAVSGQGDTSSLPTIFCLRQKNVGAQIEDPTYPNTYTYVLHVSSSAGCLKRSCLGRIVYFFTSERALLEPTFLCFHSRRNRANPRILFDLFLNLAISRIRRGPRDTAVASADSTRLKPSLNF